MFVGMDRYQTKSSGLIGSVRLIRLFDYILADLPLKSSQYTYLFPTKNIRQQFMLDDINDLRNDASRSIAEIVGPTANLT
jgi:hypothetical protein